MADSVMLNGLHLMKPDLIVKLCEAQGQNHFFTLDNGWMPAPVIVRASDEVCVIATAQKERPYYLWYSYIYRDLKYVQTSSSMMLDPKAIVGDVNLFCKDPWAEYLKEKKS